MVTNYKRGVYLEYKIKKQYEKAGYTVVRSSGSHSCIDLVAINPEQKKIVLIQCKKGALLKKEADTVALELIPFIGHDYTVSAQLHHEPHKGSNHTITYL